MTVYFVERTEELHHDTDGFGESAAVIYITEDEADAITICKQRHSAEPNCDFTVYACDPPATSDAFRSIHWRWPAWRGPMKD